MHRKPRMTVEQQELAMSCYRLAWKIALRYWRRHPKMDQDNCVGQALLALCYAAMKFQPGKGKAFRNYAITCILRKFKTDFRWGQWRKRRCLTEIWQASAIPHNQNMEHDWAGAAYEPEPDEYLSYLPSRCQPEEWNMLYRRYVLDVPVAQMAKELPRPVTRQQMHNRLHATLRKLKVKLQDPFTGQRQSA